MPAVSTIAARVLLVTGGAHRLGAAIARHAVAAGYHVAVHYHASAAAAAALQQELSAAGGTCTLHQADFAQPGAAAGVVDAATQAHGRLDVLVHSAGIWGKTSLRDGDPADVLRYTQVNVAAVYEAIQRALPWLETADGSVVTVCDAGVYRPWRDYSAYLASKGALTQLTHTLALECAPLVRVNGVAPGLALVPDDWDSARIAQATARIPLRRAGTAADVAQAVLFLAAAPYITGVILPVDGGVTLR